MSNPIKIAYHLPTQSYKHIDSIGKALKGLKCECACLKCEEKLIAVVEVKKKVKHFKHHTNVSCEGSQETALHELGKQILVNNSQIYLPIHGVINYSDPIPEKTFESKVPDVSATLQEEPIFFEILVSHAVDDDKRQFYVNGKYKSVEISLKDCLDSTFEYIENKVIAEVINKEIIYWDDEIPTETKPENLVTTKAYNGMFSFVIIGLVAIAAYFGISHLCNNRKR